MFLMQRAVWHPQFKPFIHSMHENTHIINLDETEARLRSALELTAYVCLVYALIQ